MCDLGLVECLVSAVNAHICQVDTKEDLIVKGPGQVQWAFISPSAETWEVIAFLLVLGKSENMRTRSAGLLLTHGAHWRRSEPRDRDWTQLDSIALWLVASLMRSAGCTNYRDKNLEGSSILCPFNKIMIVGSAIRTIGSQTLDSLPDL